MLYHVVTISFAAGHAEHSDGVYTLLEMPVDIGTRALTLQEIMRANFQSAWPSVDALVLQLEPRDGAVMHWRDLIVNAGGEDCDVLCSVFCFWILLVLCSCFYNCLVDVLFFAKFWMPVQEKHCTYAVTGLVEYCMPGHFVAYVKQRPGWCRCDDSVATLKNDIGAAWPRLIFLQKLRRHRPVARASGEQLSIAMLQRLPEPLRSVMDAATGGRLNLRRQGFADRERERRRKRKGLGEESVARKRLRVSERFRKRRQQHQSRDGRQQSRPSRAQAARNDARERESRERQAGNFGASGWSNNFSGQRKDYINEEDNPFARFRDNFALRRVAEEECLREWDLRPTLVAPQPCLLCDAAFADRAALLAHLDEVHGGLQRYRNSVLHLESLCPHVVTGSEAHRVHVKWS